MKVIVKETCFIDGAVRTPGLPEPFGEFEYTGDPNKLPRSLVPADGAASGAPDKSEKTGEETNQGPTANEIKAQLVAAGVAFPARATKAELIALLETTIKANAPAASGAPDKSETLPV